MNARTQELRKIAKALLDNGTVDTIIGYENGSLPLFSTPVFIDSAEDVDRLVWNSFCENNLTRYLKHTVGKVAIVVKGCDSRSLINLLKEKQVARDNLYIIGVPCHGLLDRRKIENEITKNELEILSASEDGETIEVKSTNGSVTLKRGEYLFTLCSSCNHRNPVIFDVLAGDKVIEPSSDPFEYVKRFEKMSPEERWDYFREQSKKCIRCYACREACPNCHCPECFVDQSIPQWIGTSIDESDTMMFQIIRAFHQVGRCTACGACIRACPMEIDLAFLLQKLNLDVKEFFGFISGINEDDPFPLQNYRMDDTNEFTKK